MHARMPGKASGNLQMAVYRLWGGQPGEAILRCLEAWQTWCVQDNLLHLYHAESDPVAAPQDRNSVPRRDDFMISG
jgi:hypothetical protein